MSVGVLKAKQITASGLITGRRAYFKQLIMHHASGGDAVINFYDLTTAPQGGEPYYSFDVYGKGFTSMSLVDPGVLFDDGIYVTFDVVTDITITVLYEEV